MLSLRVPLSSTLPLKILLQLSCSGGAARGSFSAVVFRETPSSSSAAVAQSWTSRCWTWRCQHWRESRSQSFLGSLAVRTSAKWSSIFFQSASEMASLCFTGASRPCRFFSFKRPSRTALALLNSGSVKMFMVMDAESQRWIAALADTYDRELRLSPPFVLTSTK